MSCKWHKILYRHQSFEFILLKAFKTYTFNSYYKIVWSIALNHVSWYATLSSFIFLLHFKIQTTNVLPKHGPTFLVYVETKPNLICIFSYWKNLTFKLFLLQGLTDKFKEKDTAYSGSATFTYESFMLTVLPFLIA